MNFTYPEPEDLGITIAPHIKKDRFHAGFLHALKGGQITEVKQLRLSFREGYRAGKLYLREVRKQRGIHNFPLQGRIRFTVH